MNEPTKQRLTKESVTAWFDTKQATNRERRQGHVTAEDVRARLESRKTSRTDQPRPSRMAQIIPAGIGVGLLVGAAVVGINSFSSTKVFETETITLARQIEAAEGERAAIPTSDENGEAAYGVLLKEQLGIATAAGEEMARLQQEYAEILFQGNGSSSDDRVSEVALRAAVDHQGEVGALIREESIPLAEAALDDDVLDPRRPWYVGFEADGITVVDPAASEWTVASVMATATGVFEVTWLNIGPGGELNAWATANFSSEDAKFGQFTVGKTTRGVDDVAQVETGRN